MFSSYTSLNCFHSLKIDICITLYLMPGSSNFFSISSFAISYYSKFSSNRQSHSISIDFDLAGPVYIFLGDGFPFFFMTEDFVSQVLGRALIMSKKFVYDVLADFEYFHFFHTFSLKLEFPEVLYTHLEILKTRS